MIPTGNAPSPGKLLDVNMLVMTGGRERAEDEYRALLAASGFRLDQVLPAHSSTSIVEASPAYAPQFEPSCTHVKRQASPSWRNQLPKSW
jgi:hypothetical protein